MSSRENEVVFTYFRFVSRHFRWCRKFYCPCLAGPELMHLTKASSWRCLIATGVAQVVSSGSTARRLFFHLQCHQQAKFIGTLLCLCLSWRPEGCVDIRWHRLTGSGIRTSIINRRPVVPVKVSFGVIRCDLTGALAKCYELHADILLPVHLPSNGDSMEQDLLSLTGDQLPCYQPGQLVLARQD